MAIGGAFGSYIDKNGMEELRKYKYVSVGSTPIDRMLNPFWERAVHVIPLWVSPNSLTLLGFICTLACMGLTCTYMPTLQEAAPWGVYLANFIFLFLYQTLDAIDGKQARRTNTSTPLGQLFDHGCDSFSTVFAALSVLGTVRMGLSISSFMLIAILQMQLYIYTWLELHFHEYRSHTGVTGVTEGQLVMMTLNMMALVLGPEIFTTPLLACLPSALSSGLLNSLLQLPIQACVAIPFYTLLIGMLLADVADGCRRAANFNAAAMQLLGCFIHVLMEVPLYASTMMTEYPVLCYWAMILNSSIIALRLNLSVTCRMSFLPVQWPVLPFWLCSLYIYLTGPATSGLLTLPIPFDSPLQGNMVEYNLYVLIGVLSWSVVYLADFLLDTVTSICSHFGIKCFSVGQQTNRKID